MPDFHGDPAFFVVFENFSHVHIILLYATSYMNNNIKI